ncbi:transposase [Pseudomonas sp. St29]|nr:transposase [Pseudomonas sp. St29]
MSLFARRVVGRSLSGKPDADLVIKPLDMAYEQRGKPQGLLFHSDGRSMAAATFASDSGVIAYARA